jgi:hypothetical protein
MQHPHRAGFESGVARQEILDVEKVHPEPIVRNDAVRFQKYIDRQKGHIIDRKDSQDAAAIENPEEPLSISRVIKNSPNQESRNYKESGQGEYCKRRKRGKQSVSEGAPISELEG